MKISISIRYVIVEGLHKELYIMQKNFIHNSITCYSTSKQELRLRISLYYLHDNSCKQTSHKCIIRNKFNKIINCENEKFKYMHIRNDKKFFVHILKSYLLLN